MRALTDDEKRARPCSQCGMPVGHLGRMRKCKACHAAYQRQYRADPAKAELDRRRAYAADRARRELARRHASEYRKLYLAEMAAATVGQAARS